MTKVKIKWTPKARKIVEKVANIPQHRFEQGTGRYAPGVACCVGAHLANEFAAEELGYADDYQGGRMKLADELKIGTMQLDNCLVYAGAHIGYHDAFGGADWRKPHKEVLTNFLNMEYLPTNEEMDEIWSTKEEL